MRTRILPFFLVLSAASLLDPTPLFPQEEQLFHELGVFGISSNSEHVEIPGGEGYGFAAFWQFGGPFLARLSYHRLSDETEKEGVVCDQYSQRINCRPEITENSVRLSGLRGSLLLTVSVWDRLQLGAGGGLSFNQVSAESVGKESDRDADLLAPNAGIIGYGALVSAAVAPLEALPLRVFGGFGVHWVGFNTCSANEPPQYDPFCGRESFQEVEFGLSFAF